MKPKYEKMKYLKVSIPYGKGFDRFLDWIEREKKKLFKNFDKAMEVDKMKPKKCDCWIGFYVDFNEVRIDVHINEVYNYLLKDCDVLFIHCPYCGKKINWAKLRKDLKEV